MLFGLSAGAPLLALGIGAPTACADAAAETATTTTGATHQNGGVADSFNGHSFGFGNSFYRFQWLRAQTLARLGDVDAAAAAIDVAEADWHPTYVLAELNALMARAWLAAAHQHLTEARHFASEAAAFTRGHGQLACEVLCLQTATQFGDTTAAGRLEELAHLVDGQRARLAARYARALDLDDVGELDLVSADFESIGDPLPRPTPPGMRR